LFAKCPLCGHLNLRGFTHCANCQNPIPKGPFQSSFFRQVHHYTGISAFQIALVLLATLCILGLIWLLNNFSTPTLLR
jgi:hypothetical protein